MYSKEQLKAALVSRICLGWGPTDLETLAFDVRTRVSKKIYNDSIYFKARVYQIVNKLSVEVLSPVMKNDLVVAFYFSTRIDKNTLEAVEDISTLVNYAKEADLPFILHENQDFKSNKNIIFSIDDVFEYLM